MSNAAPQGKAKATISWKALVIGLILTGPLVWVLLKSLSMDPHRMDAPLIGQPAPRFALKRLSDGQLVSSDSLKGKPLLLNFWATWCIPCRHEHPIMVRAAREYGDRVQFVGIVYQDRNEIVEQWLDRYGGRDYPTLIDIDSKAAMAYGVYGVPETYFIDSQGVVRAKQVGPLDPQTLQSYLEGLK